jgi:hypothetical protein
LTALLHAWQVPPQAMLQQTLLVQKPLAHSSPAEHAAPGTFWGVHVPPLFDRLQKLPPAHSPSFAQAAHTMLWQKPLWQSESTRQSLVLAHAGQELPPQSTSVSVPSCIRSVQVGATHVLDATSQTIGAAQFVFERQAMQMPEALQTPVPLPSGHAVATATGVWVGLPIASQPPVWQASVAAGTSCVSTTIVTLPMPSHSFE